MTSNSKTLASHCLFDAIFLKWSQKLVTFFLVASSLSTKDMKISTFFSPFRPLKWLFSPKTNYTVLHNFAQVFFFGWIKFRLFLATQETFTNFYGNEAKQKIFEKKINQNGRLKKTELFNSANYQYFLLKISEIDPWVYRLNWCKGHWCGWNYMVIRLSDVNSKTG